MLRYFLLFFLLPYTASAQQFSKKEVARWHSQAKKVTIIRDNWGIPHIYGKTDADAVFGLMYAQCEDDFKRVELNYITVLGRLAEIRGEAYIYEDLLVRLVIDSAEAVNDYKKAPNWLRKLLQAYADGLNYYLYKHPEVKPVLLKRFEPWYPLLWTDGSISAINTDEITVKDLEQFYSGAGAIGAVRPKKDKEESPIGSNGFAFAPSITESGKAILYINPHVTFYFRPEVHMVSEEGLNAYGAVTWGQFFVYQGFNAFCGWMHTSSNIDVADTYIETIKKQNDGTFYLYDNQLNPVQKKPVSIKFVKEGKLLEKKINALFTHHGPVMAEQDGKWLSLRANNRSMNGLIQSWKRTKANSFENYQQVMGLLSNTSNNTVYADAAGNIAYWHGNYIPKRNPSFDWNKPVDGSNPATEWQGLHPVEESIHIYNPSNGWLQNCNSTPFTAAGKNSPKQENFPSYMKTDDENFRGINAVRLLERENTYDLDGVIAMGYDNYVSAFEILIPALLKAYDQGSKGTDSSNNKLSGPMTVLRKWNFRSDTQSIPTTLAIEWAQKLYPAILQTKIEGKDNADLIQKSSQYAKEARPENLLQAMEETVRELEKKFGTWEVPWGDLNRFQRISGDIDQVYKDSLESLPVGFVSSLWGMLPSYNSRYFPGTKNRYGVNGNSFVCAVEFGERIKAKSLLAGGESGNPGSPHFKDQAKMYTQGKFKDVLFYKEDILKYAKKTYHPGE